jgi:dTDP-4-amino-4,6-dideoxygalactose transaminase
MIYYPLPLYKQTAYKQDIQLPHSEVLSTCVVSLPIGTDMEQEQIDFIIENVLKYFKK